MAKDYIPHDGPIVTRAEAVRAGSKHYFNGIPCSKGHISVRRVAGACMECDRLAVRKPPSAASRARYRAKVSPWRGFAWNAVKQATRRSDPKTREKVLAQDRAYKKLRAATPTGAINNSMKVYIARSLKGKKGGRSWEALVDYTLPQLCCHLERQFTKGMTWENRGKWHIDHIVPLALFKFKTPDDPEFKAAWALTNLRPLWAAENIRKHAKREFLL